MAVYPAPEVFYGAAVDDAVAVHAGRERRPRRTSRPVARSAAPHTVVVRPSLLLTALVTAMTLGLPAASRHGNSLLNTALQHGTGSRQVTTLVAYGVGVLAWGVMAALRSRTTLRAVPGRSPELTVRTAFRHRVVDLSPVREVRLVTVASGSRTRQVVVLLDAKGRVVATPPSHRGTWTRDDAVDLLRSAGVTVVYEHRLSAVADVEAAYPGSTAWAERHPRACAALVCVAILPAIVGIVWFFELG